MSVESILKTIDDEIERLKQARNLLGSSEETAVAAKKSSKGRGVLSAEARNRIAAAQRRRWANLKKATR